MFLFHKSYSKGKRLEIIYAQVNCTYYKSMKWLLHLSHNLPIWSGFFKWRQMLLTHRCPETPFRFFTFLDAAKCRAECRVAPVAVWKHSAFSLEDKSWTRVKLQLPGVAVPSCCWAGSLGPEDLARLLGGPAVLPSRVLGAGRLLEVTDSLCSEESDFRLRWNVKARKDW